MKAQDLHKILKDRKYSFIRLSPYSPSSYLCFLDQHTPCWDSRTGIQGMFSYKSGHPQQVQ